MRIKTFFKTLIPLKTLLLLLVFTLSYSTLWSQADRPCGFDESIVAFAEGNPTYLQAFEDANQQITDAINQNPNIGGQLVQIPVVVHIMHDETQEINENISDQQVFDAIDELNDNFAGPGVDLVGHPFDATTNIRFTLAKIDPDGNCTNGIVRFFTDRPFVDNADPEATDEILKNQSRWDTENYLNIWVVEDANGANGYVNPLPITLAGEPFIGTPERDGIVIRFDRFGSTGEAINNTQNTLTHEAGHYLFLLHPWSNFNPNFPDVCDRDCHHPDDCDILGDRVCDTNPCTDFILVSPVDCNGNYAGQCEAENCINGYPDAPHPKESYMSYSSDCHTGFSLGQSVRMHGGINEVRANLVSAANLINTGIDLLLPVQQDITIAQNTTWDLPNLQGADPERGVICIDGTVTIQPGATLQVDPGVIVMFGPQSSVIVEDGARLAMQNSTFTSCDTWQGIQLRGDSGLSQQPGSNQGTAFLNGATIEHAEVGIYTGEPTGDFSFPVAGTTGGVVQAFNSTFRDNAIDVAFWDYANINPFWGLEQNNRSNFGLCHSLLTDEYRFSLDDFDQKLEAFIEMTGVNGIAIRGHHFEDQRSILNAERPSGKVGILSNSSGFSVDERCSGLSPLPIPPTCNGTRTRFVNLGYGIHSTQDNPSFSINVRNSDFECWHGIYFAAIVNAPNIHINNFLVLQMSDMTDGGSGNPLLVPSYGIYLDHCDLYSVEENDLEGQVNTGSPFSADEHAGIVVRNNHGNPTEIYNNTLRFLSVATEGISQNRQTGPLNLANGLEFRCNDFSEARIDIFVAEDLSANPLPVPVVGIRPIQNRPANEFSENPNAIFNIWNNFGIPQLQYIHHSDATPNQRQSPDNNLGNVFVQNSGIPVDASTCPNNILNHMGIDDGIITLGGIKNTTGIQYNGTLTTLGNLVDNGNTPQMLNWVQTSNHPRRAFRTYFRIMQQAPFTSDIVLEEVSKKEVGFSKGMIRNILRQHPQAAKSEQIQTNLDNRINQLPQFMRNQINQGLDIIGAKEQMELDAASYKRERDQAISKAVQLLASDTLDRSTEMIDFLTNTGDIGFEYRLAEIHDARNETELAGNILNAISTWELSEKTASDHSDYMNFRTLMQNWKAEDKNLAALEEGDIELLHQYAVKPNITAIKAISLLELNGIFEYLEPVYFPEEEPQLRVITNVQEDVIISDKMLIYPNPANEYITVEYVLKEPSDKTTIVITDTNGRVVYQENLAYNRDELIIPINHLPVGQYFCTLKNDNIVMTEKFLLVK